jgi:hypothetical protein
MATEVQSTLRKLDYLVRRPEPLHVCCGGTRDVCVWSLIWHGEKASGRSMSIEDRPSAQIQHIARKNGHIGVLVPQCVVAMHRTFVHALCTWEGGREIYEG